MVSATASTAGPPDRPHSASATAASRTLIGDRGWEEVRMSTPASGPDHLFRDGH